MQARLDFSAVAPATGVAPRAFHPAVAQWFAARFGRATEVQARAWPITAARRHALITAPTGSGKTLAAFLSAINDLVVEGLAHGLSDEVHVLYVSPLKALSNDIRKNLQEPLAGIRARLSELGLPDVPIRDAVRTGDTPATERRRMSQTPPHILVTTPESLYLLLSADTGRRMLGSVKTVIVDELHALAGNKRGAHLMLSLERLQALCAQAPSGKGPVRIGLSATVKPIEEMARYLIGTRQEHVEIVDAGHLRERDLALELPRAPLSAVMANEVWDELYDRLAELIREHRTTLVFVNQRRIAERVARHLAERLGEEHVAAHHGSLAKEHRLAAEQRLKAGTLKALVATSSLELGIDIGDIDLVCQLGSPRSMSVLVQRVGRAGHKLGALPKGRLFPLALDDLLECAALLDAVNHGELDRIRVPRAPLDVLAQQIVAEAACREWPLEDLFTCFKRAQAYRDLPRADFEQLVQMLAEGYSTRRGRRGAWLHYDAVNRVLRARRGARLAALSNGGVIPDQFDYEVVLLPEGQRVGTLNEDFAFESIPGDIFQLGNVSYRIAKIETGKVYVEDARGQPPTIPFWFGEGLSRTDELSHAVSRLAAAAAARLADGTEECARWLREDLHLPPAAARQLADYLAASQAALGALPTEDTLVLERFFDEVGDTHLVIHSVYGSRVNRAWGLALRKRFCRKFNFELQASALEDSIVLSLGPTHSFPLIEVKDFLKSASVRDLLVQALLDAPMFGTRWRWNATIALAVQRMRNGRRTPPQFQRSDAEDLLACVFPDSQACQENIVGDREIPDHPLVRQTLDDCLHETMDVEGLERLLWRIEQGRVRVIACDLTAPSPLSHAILSARPYAFLDDGAAEERRTRAVRTQPLMDVRSAADLGRLDAQAIAQVRAEAWPEAVDADELHDALGVHAFLTEDELARACVQWRELAAELERRCRATRLKPPGGVPLWVVAERLHEFLALFPTLEPAIRAVSATRLEPEGALREILRGRLELLGPVTDARLAAPLGLPAQAAQAALRQLEAEGAVMRGDFEHQGTEQWCERRLLARMHRYTRERLRREIQPVPPAAFLRFLFRWHRLAGAGAEDERGESETGLLEALRCLEGCAVPAAAWEEDLLPARVKHYLPYMLDKLCAAGRIVWLRPPACDAAADKDKRKNGPIRTTPIVLCERTALVHWQTALGAPQAAPALTPKAQIVFDALRAHGASFFSDLAQETGLIRAELEAALGELVSHGLVHCDSFAGLRGLVMPAERRHRLRRRNHGLGRDADLDEAGRWSLAHRPQRAPGGVGALAEPHVEHIARVLLRRYGVVFRKLLEREEGLPPWRELHYVYRRLEARGEIRGGRFVGGFSGEQFALPEAVAPLRRAAREDGTQRICLSAADPLNLVGVLTPGEKVPRQPGNRVLFENGTPIAVQLGGEVRYLKTLDAKAEWEFKNLLIRKQRPGGYLEAPPRPQ